MLKLKLKLKQTKQRKNLPRTTKQSRAMLPKMGQYQQKIQRNHHLILMAMRLPILTKANNSNERDTD